MPQAPSTVDQTRSIIRLSTTPLLSLKRNKRSTRRLLFVSSSSRLIRQVLGALAVATVLLTLLFIYSTSLRRGPSKSQLLLQDDLSGSPPVILTWQQVEKLVDQFVCNQFKAASTTSPTAAPPKTCQAPLEPFDSAAFEHRPSGKDLLPFSRMLLLVLFNHPHAETIPFVEMLYRPHFAHIVYCLPEGADDHQKIAKTKSMPVFDRTSHHLPLFRILNSTFFMDVEIVTYPQPFLNRMAGENNYACFVEVSRRFLLGSTAESQRDQLRMADFDGILVAADDLLVHVWNLARPGYDLNKPWVMDRPMRVYDLQAEHECAVDEPLHDSFGLPDATAEQQVASRCELDVDWQWFRLYSVEMGEFASEMERYALETRLFGDCHHRLRETLGGQSRRFIGNGGAGDFYYVPTSLWLHLHDVFSLMAAHNVFVEIAVPTALRCLVANASTGIVHVQGEGMNWAYARSRNRPWSAYSAASSLLLPYYHPLKVAELLMPPVPNQSLSAANRLQDLACFVCKTVLPKFNWFRQYVANNNTPPVERPPWL